MTDITLPLKGHCLCGAIEFEAIEEPADIMYCHCTMCQRWSSGSMTITAKFPGKSVDYTKGHPKIYKTSEKGRRGFCIECGSQLSFQYLVSEASDTGAGSSFNLETDVIYIPVGTFENTESLKPRNHYCIDTQLSWLNIDDGIPRRGYGEEKS